MQNKKMAIASVIVIGMTFAFTWLPSESCAQVDNNKQGKLSVGTVVAPPFAMKGADGTWEGISIDLWQAVASVMGVQYEIRKSDTFGQLVDAVENGKLDVALALAVTEKHEIALEFSNSYYRSGLAIAVSGDSGGRGWSGFAGRMDISRICEVIGLLILLWLIAGVTVWVFEGRRNREMFGGGPIKGLGHAVWWAAVTMTTVGYGDKAPKTFGGRIVAIIWMLASIVLISSFTASMSASLTAEKLAGKVRGLRDLPHVRVGSMAQSEALEWLVERGIAPASFLTDQEGLQAIVDNKIDAFVYDEFLLKYIVKTDFPARVHLLAGTFDHYYVSMGMPNGSPLREPINRALLKIMEKEGWNRLVARYIGSNR
ncbi:MAG: transporter substrate-binding domain-containing protein [Desulfosarcina sp.]|nr:transporter substrate-binding domain-containing protein [Desulfobacterales bacterium]